MPTDVACPLIALEAARRASINVKSSSQISELVYWLLRDFSHSIVEEIRGLDQGFHRLTSQPGSAALDYIRGNLMDFEEGAVLPHDVQGKQNDIIDFVMPDLQTAIQRRATVYLFGEPYSDRQGIHDVHMNQGSVASFARYNGVWQDGGVLIHYAQEDRFDAIGFIRGAGVNRRLPRWRPDAGIGKMGPAPGESMLVAGAAPPPSEMLTT